MAGFDKRKLATRTGSREHRQWLKESIEKEISSKSPEEVATKLAERIDRLEQDRIRDPLTGLFNRGFMGVLLGLELAQGKLSKEPLGIAILDIDHFKSINDTEPDGHAAGDRTIIEFSRILKESVGELAVVGRWGGEEFAIIFPQMAHNRLKEVLLFIGETTSNQLAKRAKLSKIQITTSIGAYISVGDESATESIDKADKLMYQAKDAGRNRLALPDELVKFS